MTRGHGDKMSDLMIQKAIAALLRSSCLEEAAQRLGIHRATLWRWHRLPKFRKAYNEAVKQLRESNVADFLDDLKKGQWPNLQTSTSRRDPSVLDPTGNPPCWRQARMGLPENRIIAANGQI